MAIATITGTAAAKHDDLFHNAPPVLADAYLNGRSPVIVIRLFHDLNRMSYLIGCQMVELVPATETIRKNFFGPECLDPFDQLVCHLDGALVKVTFEAHDARSAAAIKRPLDAIDLEAWNQRQQFGIGRAYVLFPEVAGGIIGRTRLYTAKSLVKLPGRMKFPKVFP